MKFEEVPIPVADGIIDQHKKTRVSDDVQLFAGTMSMIGCPRLLRFSGILGLVSLLLGLVAEIFTHSLLDCTGQFHPITFIDGLAVLVFGLLLVTSGLVPYPLVQIPGQREEREGAPLWEGVVERGISRQPVGQVERLSRNTLREGVVERGPSGRLAGQVHG